MTIPRSVMWVIEGTTYMLSKVGALMFVLPIFFFPVVAAFAFGGWFSVIYMRAQLSVKREMSNARAPVMGHFGSAIAGLGVWLILLGNIQLLINGCVQFRSVRTAHKRCSNRSRVRVWIDTTEQGLLMMPSHGTEHYTSSVPPV